MCWGEHCWRSNSQELKIHPLCPLGAGDVPWWEVATWLGWLTCPTVQGEVSVWEGGGEWQRSWARCVNGRGNYDAERQKGTLANASSERERQLSAWSKSPCEFKTASTQTQALKKTQVLHFSVRNVRIFCLFSDCWVIRVCIQDFLHSHLRWNINSQLNLGVLLTAFWLWSMETVVVSSHPSVCGHLSTCCLSNRVSFLATSSTRNEDQVVYWVYRREYGFQDIR